VVEAPAKVREEEVDIGVSNVAARAEFPSPCKYFRPRVTVVTGVVAAAVTLVLMLLAVVLGGRGSVFVVAAAETAAAWLASGDGG
jgi:hypothetical protein